MSCRALQAIHSGLPAMFHTDESLLHTDDSRTDESRRADGTRMDGSRDSRMDEIRLQGNLLPGASPEIGRTCES